MSGIIHRLPEVVANQIAAGEVVQRPASVVKELMENAVDAGSKMVVVAVRDGGKESIQVIDDGEGMAFEDAAVAFEKHATSKLEGIDDLYALNTFGFRGEALASIASVAEVKMKSRREEDEMGVVVEINGGEIVEHRRDAVSKGTQFTVRNLFYNVPARRRFLKSTRVEYNNILFEFNKIALCYPKVTLSLLHNDKYIFNLPMTNLRRRVADVMGKALNNNLMELYVETSIVEIKGYISTPSAAKRSPEQFMFVNNRYIKYPYLNKAVMKAYEKLLPAGDASFPHYFLYFTIDPAKIDVNIHPAKTEVKFEEENEIWQILYAAVKSTLGKNGIMPMIDFETDNRIDLSGGEKPLDQINLNQGFNASYNPFDERFSFSQALYGKRPSTLADSETDEPSGHERSAAQRSSGGFTSRITLDEEIAGEVTDGDFDFSLSRPEADIAETESSAFSMLTSQERAVRRFTFEDAEAAFTAAPGQPSAVYEEVPSQHLFSEEAEEKEAESVFLFGEKYLAASVSGQLLLIHCRRAMSRILYERYSRQVQGGTSLASQRLIFPITIPLSVGSRALIDACRGDLLQMGFEVAESTEEEGAIEITGVPADMQETDIVDLFERILDSISQDDTAGYNLHKREALIANLSAAASRRDYGRLTEEEMRYLVRELFACGERVYTPFGKRIMVPLDVPAVEKLFGV